MLCKKNVVIPYPADRVAPERISGVIDKRIAAVEVISFASPGFTIHVLAYAIDEYDPVPTAAIRRTNPVPEPSGRKFISDCTSTWSSGTIITGTLDETMFAKIRQDIVVGEQLIVVEVV